jgi:thioesterase domain-containing protein/acyl carrier protein
MVRPPVSPVQLRLARIWGEILDAAAVDITDGFFDLGADSLQATRLLAAIRREFGRDLTFSDLLSAPTIERMAWILEGAEALPSRSCLVALQESGSKPPFFCVHGGDGEVMIFQDLARSMGRDRPFYGLQAAGLHEPEIPLGSVETMAARYIEEVRRVRPQGPYFVGGFCLGAFIALEIAIQLRADNQEVGLLAVINTDAAWRDANSTFAGLRRHWRHLFRLPPGQKLKYLRGRAGYRVFRIRSGIQEACYRTWAMSGRTPPTRLRRLHAREMCHRAGQDYTPGTYPGKITCFHGAAEPEAKPADFWNRIAQEGIEVRSVPGEGLAVLRPPAVQILAEQLRQAIDAGA